MADNKKNKGFSLEEALLEFAEARELMQENVKATLKATALNEALKESLEEDDMEGEVETPETPAIDYDETSVDDEGEEMETPEEGEVETPEEGEVEASGDGVEGDLDMPDEPAVEPKSIDSYLDGEKIYRDDEGNIIVAGEIAPDILAQLVQNPEVDEVIIAKMEDPVYRIEVEGGEEEDEEDEEEPSMEGEIEESEDKEDEKPVNENAGQFSTIIRNKDKKISIYESKIRELQEALKKVNNKAVSLKKELNEAKAENEKAFETLTEAQAVISELSLVNKNLAHVSKLFTEHVVSATDKKEILEKFDSVTTSRESELVYEFYNSSLNKRKTAVPNKEQILESKTANVKNPVKKIKESNALNESQSPFKRFADYKI